MVTFEQFKRRVIRKAKLYKVTHLVPDSNTLFRMWERGVTPEQVVLIDIPRREGDK